MTWTYDGTPGTDTSAKRRDAVRLLVGDTDTNDQQITDEEITFFLDGANDEIYTAAGRAARSIAAEYARLVDNDVEGISARFSQRQKHYLALAVQMERQAKSGTSIGKPVFGGVSKDEIDSVEDDDDRVDPAFTRRQFRNPNRREDDDTSWHR